MGMVVGVGVAMGMEMGMELVVMGGQLKAVIEVLTPQLVYDGVPRGDLQQRELRLSVLSEEGFWENILLGEVGIRLRDLDLAQEKMGWFALGSRGHGTL